MKRFFFLFFLIFPFLIFCQNTSEKRAYEPWYTGPLISTGPNNISPGELYIQPYLYYNELYNKASGNTFNFITQLLFQAPLNKWLDITIALTGTYNQRKHQSAFEFADTSVSLGFQLLKGNDFTSIPSIRLKIYENFPTGKYNNLNPNKLGVDISGSGTYETGIALIIGKTSYWFKNHPINWTIDSTYFISSSAKVKNLHRYGGGIGTNGKVNIGNSFIEDIAIEYSFNQRWVFTLDNVYFYSAKETFSGNPGIDFFGNVAINTSPSVQQISFAPGIEYNFNINLGILGGVYFSVWQKNTSRFVTGIISVAYTF
jgi:hypothetical protein